MKLIKILGLITAFLIVIQMNTYAQTKAALPRLKITVGNKTVVANLIDSKTTREFMAMLPLTLTLNDLNGREKYSSLPKALSKEGTVVTTFKEGELCYWLGGGVAIFYNNDGHEVKAGLIVLARLVNGLELFKAPEDVTVKFEVTKD